MPLWIGASYENKYGNYAKLIEIWDENLALVYFDSLEFGASCFGLISIKNLVEEKFSSPYDKTVRGVAYMGAGPYNSVDHERAYSRWSDMIRRVEEAGFDNKPSYMGVGISLDFLNFQNFAKWFYDQPGHDKSDFHLDKDLLSKPGLVIYSAETCCFVPAQINCTLPRFKDKTKYRDFVLALADKYKDEISPEAYEALLNYY